MVHAIDTQLASQHKSRRWRLHNHYKTYPTKEQAVMNPPRGVKVPDWVLLCERFARFASEDFQVITFDFIWEYFIIYIILKLLFLLILQKISTRNKLNRSKNEIPPANGTKSMAREIHMVSSRLTDLCFLRFNLNFHLSNGFSPLSNFHVYYLWVIYLFVGYDNWF